MEEEEKTYTSLGELSLHITELEEEFERSPNYGLYEKIKELMLHANQMAGWKIYSI